MKGLARTHPLRWKEKEKMELYVVKNFHESGWGENVCNLFVLHLDMKNVRITSSYI